MRFAIGILIFFATITIAIVIMGGHILDFINLPTIILLLLLMLAVVVMKGGLKPVITATNALISKKYHITDAEKDRSISLFLLLKKTVKYGSVSIFLISLMNMLLGLSWSDPGLNTRSLSGAMAVNFQAALLSIVYGIIIIMVFLNPAIALLKERVNIEA